MKSVVEVIKDMIMKDIDDNYVFHMVMNAYNHYLSNNDNGNKIIYSLENTNDICTLIKFMDFNAHDFNVFYINSGIYGTYFLLNIDDDVDDDNEKVTMLTRHDVLSYFNKHIINVLTDAFANPTIYPTIFKYLEMKSKEILKK